MRSFSDASYLTNRTYGHPGVVIGIRETGNSDPDTFRVIDWKSHRQKRLSNSSFVAEISACATADDRGCNLREASR